ERLDRFAAHDISASLGGFIEHHAIEMTATDLPGGSGGELPFRIARGDGNEPGVHALGAVNFYAMFHWVVGPRHVFLQAEPAEQLAGFTGHRFADVETREGFLFEDNGLDSFAKEEHGCGRAPGPATDY